MRKRFLVTGGEVYRLRLRAACHCRTEHHVLVVDKLTYAGNLDSLALVKITLASHLCGRISPTRAIKAER